MALKRTRTIELPAHRGEGGFDHAAIHEPSRRLYVAHTANDCVDVVDLEGDRYVGSIPGLRGVAGVLVSAEAKLLLTSNRGETTVGVVSLDGEGEPRIIPVGGRPNGLAFHARRELLLAANIDRPGESGIFTASLVDLKRSAMISDLSLPGRPRWAIFDALSDRFYVNIRDPPQIVAVDAKEPTRLAQRFPIPFAGPHGLDLDDERRVLYCACDAGRLARLDLRSGAVGDVGALTGPPDVALVHPGRARVYVAINEPGGIDVVDTDSGERIENVPTEPGSGTMALDYASGELCVMLQDSHSVAIYRDDSDPERKA